MDTAAQDYQRLLTEAIQKQMLILGPQITLLKAQKIPGMTVTPTGTVTAISDTPQNVITHFLEEFRDLSGPLVKKTMKPLLVIVAPAPTTAQTATTAQPPAPTETKPEQKPGTSP